MVELEMEPWRSYFATSGADIWTIIHQAITIAAADYPKDFREKRVEIAETLFARKLLQVHVTDDLVLIPKKIKVRNGETRDACMSADPHTHARFCDDAETLPEELQEHVLLIRDIDGIKGIIADPDQPESIILEVLQRLKCMQITVEMLKVTEIGKHVNSLKKHVSKRVHTIAKELVRHWKVLVDEWVNSATDDTAATDCDEPLEACKREDKLAHVPPPDKGTLLEDGAPTVDLSQLFSFVDGDICPGEKDGDYLTNSMEHSMKGSVHNSCRSQSGSMLTYSSDCDAKASTNHPWGLGTPDERGSTTLDIYPNAGKSEKREQGHIGQPKKGHEWSNDDLMHVFKSTTTGSGPCKPRYEVPKVKTAPGQQANTRKPIGSVHNGVGCSMTTMQKSNADKSSLLKADKSQVDQKLEIAKRKLHQGYQQAENVKKQRTVQVLDLPELPKGTTTPVNKGAKMSATLQNKAGRPSGYGNQSRRFG